MTRTRLRELCEKATPGPWTAEYDNADNAGGGWWYDIGPARVGAGYLCSDAKEKQVEHDAAFIAAARTAVPELLDEVERLRAELADARRQAEADRADANRIMAEYDKLWRACAALGGGE